MLEKPAQTQVAINDVIAKRWSPRAFDAQRAVSPEQIIALLEAARWAPSCRGEEPWRYLIFDKQSQPQAWEQAFACLDPSNQVWVQHAPLLMLATVVTTFKHNGQFNPWAAYDCGAASENICLQAVTMGLIVHQMGGFDADKAKAQFNIPDDITCLSMLAIGYQTTADILPDDYKARELAPRQRQPIPLHFFAGEWDQAYQ